MSEELFDIRQVIEFDSAEEILGFIGQYPEVWTTEHDQQFACGFFTGYREALARVMQETGVSQSRNLNPMFFERDGVMHVLDIVVTTSREGYLKWWEETGKEQRKDWKEEVKQKLFAEEQEV